MIERIHKIQYRNSENAKFLYDVNLGCGMCNFRLHIDGFVSTW